MALTARATRRQSVAWNRLEKAIGDTSARTGTGQVASGLADFFGFFALLLVLVLPVLRTTGLMSVGRPSAPSPGSGPARKNRRHSGESCDLFAIIQAVMRSTSGTKLPHNRMLARISHELRAPLNAIIGFAEVMIGQRLGSLGNERYLEYMTLRISIFSRLSCAPKGWSWRSFRRTRTG